MDWTRENAARASKRFVSCLSAEAQLPKLGIKPSYAMLASFSVLEALGQRVFIDFGYENAEAKAVALPEESMRKVFGL